MSCNINTQYSKITEATTTHTQPKRINSNKTDSECTTVLAVNQSPAKTKTTDLTIKKKIFMCVKECCNHCKL